MIKRLEWVAYWLLVIGGLNWGLIAAFQLNLVESLLGAGVGATLVYGLVGLAAVYNILTAAKLLR